MDLSKLSIRDATYSDFNEFINVFSVVEELHRKNLSRKYKKPEILFSKEDFEEMIKNDNTKIYLACLGESVIGILLAYVKTQINKPILKDRTYIDIDTICVIDEYRHKGIGKMLLSKFEKWAKNNNILDIQLNVREFNENAKKFYSNNGFSNISHIMRKTL